MKKEDFSKDFIKTAKNWCASFAPGRIEFLGNHLDYNGGNVLGMAVNAGIYCLGIPNSENGALGITEEKNQFSLFSEGFENASWTGVLDNIERQKGKSSWTNYCLGVLKELQIRNLAPSEGFRLIFTTDLPTSVGLSSSAALELATALTLLELAGKSLPVKELAILCRTAENEFVGLPCGILDQGTSAFGQKDHLVHIDCKNEFFSNLPIPSGTELWIFNTGIKHDLVDSLYSTRHQECVEALLKGKEMYPQKTHLVDFSKNEILNLNLPENLNKRAIHVSEEQARVLKFKEGLSSNLSAEKLGKLLQESHESSSRNFENSCKELDFLADNLNSHAKVLGARLTGGGFGGAVMAWTHSTFDELDAKGITDKYRDKFDRDINFHHFLPSDGARKEDLLKK